MQFILLTHQREIDKQTNTGAVLVKALEDKAKVIVWERKTPSQDLLNLIEQGAIALLYPTEDSQAISSADTFERYIIIDGTWQEATKIYNRSPYLHHLPKRTVAGESAYRLRRNQRPGGLCTAECAIETLKETGFEELGQRAQSELKQFLSMETRL